MCYHYNQAVHAMNLVAFHDRHRHVDRDLVAENIPRIKRELTHVNGAAREMEAELERLTPTPKWRARHAMLEDDEAFVRVRGFLCGAAAIGACYREYLDSPQNR